MKPAPVIELQSKDLTPDGEIFCPNPKADMKLWNTHPRVFLNMAQGEAKCPYCGTQYRMRAGETVGAGH